LRSFLALAAHAWLAHLIGPRRILVYGVAGAGKTTLSRRLAQRLELPHIERDLLSNEASAEFRAEAAAVSSRNAWIFDGPPYYAEDIVLPRAQLIVALDYPKHVVMRRVFWRSLRGRCRWWVVWWAWKTWKRRRSEIDELERDGHAVVRLRSPRDAARWLAQL
jgi:adenylate kinase family enzyme